jgi:lysozyme family protein
MPTTYTPQLAAEYQQLFDSCRIKETKYPEIDRILAKIVAGRARYETIASTTKVPWYFTGIVHSLEIRLRQEQ